MNYITFSNTLMVTNIAIAATKIVNLVIYHVNKSYNILIFKVH